jgi:hypothetical protein
MNTTAHLGSRAHFDIIEASLWLVRSPTQAETLTVGDMAALLPARG